MEFKDLFCQIYINYENSIEKLIALIRKTMNCDMQDYTLFNNILEIDTIENDEYEKNSNDFLFWKFYLEIEPIENIAEDKYIAAIHKLIKALYEKNISTIATCDLEDQLNI